MRLCIVYGCECVCVRVGLRKRMNREQTNCVGVEEIFAHILNIMVNDMHKIEMTAKTYQIVNEKKKKRK